MEDLNISNKKASLRHSESLHLSKKVDEFAIDSELGKLDILGLLDLLLNDLLK